MTSPILLIFRKILFNDRYEYAKVGCFVTVLFQNDLRRVGGDGSKPGATDDQPSLIRHADELQRARSGAGADRHGKRRAAIAGIPADQLA